ncbi:MAG: hypothetical protein MH186_03210 [Marinobacter sp.]|nr:hypothetical protein [Marinobacter sp.]
MLVFASEPARWRAAPVWWVEWAKSAAVTLSPKLQVTLPGGGGELMGGLAIGDTSAVSDELDAAMKTSSLSHLAAVSAH